MGWRFVFVFLCIFFMTDSSFAAEQKTVFKKILDEFPLVYCERSFGCEEENFKTKEDCEEYLRSQIFQTYAGTPIETSHKKVEDCVKDLSQLSCDKLKKSTPRSCRFLEKL